MLGSSFILLGSPVKCDPVAVYGPHTVYGLSEK